MGSLKIRLFELLKLSLSNFELPSLRLLFINGRLLISTSDFRDSTDESHQILYLSIYNLSSHSSIAQCAGDCIIANCRRRRNQWFSTLVTRIRRVFQLFFKSYEKISVIKNYYMNSIRL